MSSPRQPNNDHADSIAQSAIIQQVGAIWSDVLQCGEISAGQNFFELGGDSLMSMMAAFRISDELQIELPLSAFTEHPTFGEFCTMINHLRLQRLPSGTSSSSKINDETLEEGAV